MGEARRVAAASANALGFTSERVNDIGIVVTEAANNICSHAGKGEFLICPVLDAEHVGLDLLALDAGPGIRDVGRAFEDGFSTAGTAGQGLGAMKRLSDDFSVYSITGRGTAVFSRFSGAAQPPYSVVNIPFPGEIECGDAFLGVPGHQRSLYMVVDGLGHGAGASEAATEARSTVLANRTQALTDIITVTHDALKKTRGAAMSLACVDHSKQVVTYAGVGNISGSIIKGTTTRSMVSQNGTLGAALPTVQEFTYPYETDSLLLMFSDGVNSRSSLSGYPGIQSRPLPLIAGLLYRDFSRRRDDATVLLAKLGNFS